MTLLSKNIDVTKSFVYGAYLVLKKLKHNKDKKISFYSISEELKKAGINRYRQQFFCLMFLYACDLIIFNEPYIELKNDN
ncbi:MAG: hypothetical protein HRU35_02110 [Rickettsiaceae bacterium]|nr:hypothetical protein [Rickettsiaceae bacterium]